MFKLCFLFISFVSAISALPLDILKGIAEGYRFNDFDNYLPKYDDVISYQYSANNLEDEDLKLKVKVKSEESIYEEGSKISNPPQEVVNILDMENTTSTFNNSETVENATTSAGGMNISFDSIRLSESNLEINKSIEENESSRWPRQESNETKSDPEFESQEEGSSEEDGNMVTGLISAFLGGLSRPDGSIDLEAIVGLLGSLSTQNDDGTYDFQGLTDLLRGFFGGGGDEGGGSDIGSFLGGLLGAVIKGIANPPGAKGAGIFTGKVVTGILPALSAPPPADDMDMMKKPQGLDSGGFLSGLLKTIFSSSSGGNNQGGGGGSNPFKVIFQLISSVLSSSSSSSSKTW